MNNVFKKVIAFLSLGVFCAAMCPVIPVSADDHDYSDMTVLSSIDLSQSVYFPEVGDQGEDMNSCGAFASTYYQFTYEANMANGIVTTPENTYSPAWTYNLANKGGNNTAGIDNYYAVLYAHGALRMEDCPYDADNYDYGWSTNTNAMIEALHTRIEYYFGEEVKITTTETNKIDSVSDELLTEIKQYLCAGRVLTVGVMYKFADDDAIGVENWFVKQATNNEWAVYQAKWDSKVGGHAMTVVGYDDNIACDINGDGVIEASERGAFKLVNSYGEDWANGGYIWVMYDALNIDSANSDTDWEDSDRMQFFDGAEADENTFRYIHIAQHEVNLVGLLTFTTDYRYAAKAFTYRNSVPTYNTADDFDAYGWLYSLNNAPYTGTIALDYSTFDDDIENCLSGFEWFARVENHRDSPGNITNVSYKIVDDLGVQVKDLGTIATQINPGGSVNKYATLNLRLGDVDYDSAVTSGDTSFIMAYIVKSKSFSTLQKTLADYNQDQAVDVLDITAINNAMSAAESAKFTAYIAEEYDRLASTPQAAYADMTPEQAQAYAELVTQLYELLCTAA